MTSSKYITKVHEPWTEIVTKKRAIRDAQIDKHWKAHTNSTFDRISSETVDVEVLTSLLRDGKVSAVKVIHAYIRREVEITTNCLTEICFDDALEQARRLDGFQQEHGQLLGPLHGVPVTVKDQFNITGLDSTLGYIGKAFAPAENDALLIQTLKKLGAVIIAKTNLPQSIMWCETDNPLWGLTTHPDDPKLTPGGSSGGEAAMLATGGSMIGWGTDIGGSIRIPCHMHGLWGLKPSSGRLSYHGVEVTLEGQQHIPSAIGPMARTLTSLKLVTKLAIEAEPWKMDPQLPPLPWREDLFQNFVTKRLVIGSMLDDGMVKVHPPVERVFRNVVAKLEAAGHEVIEWDSSLNSSIIDIMDGYYAADGGEDIRRAVAAGGEPFIPQIEAFVNRGKPISAFEYWQLNKRKVATQQAYHDMWDSKRSTSGRSVDVLLVPTMPHTAVPHGSCRWTGYTKIFNFLDYTALVFPAGNASKDGDDRYFWDHIPRNETDAWNQQLYDPMAMDGRCVGLQIIGRRFEEEKVLGAAQQIHKLL
ncbi:amidase signature domain-containing protein [Fusarium oxysporum Fo47]|uniref:amidase signature domain-containing protein n=1 Tax=Fusarium oxysporum Fo47 TaxID=660027 RepID=UPI0028699DBC|nr:amidase signature domain-containing protein [Fusarium oxysporum Fo47]QKD51970.2 amidase signature domain-containing protein [Fusarium oxysporum Fo47]